MPALRPYQIEPLRAILRSVRERAGRTFTVMMSRQAGKNELSAQIEVAILALAARRGGDGIKASPTFRPQTLNSMERLKRRLNDAGFSGFWTGENGYAVRLGNARMLFFSASPGANVVGATAGLLLEIDEAQDVAADKYARDFRPMGATSNVTTVLYGTAWDDSTLLETTKQQNLELERRDGVRRHFEYDWQTVAAFNPDYRRYVEGELERLGADHPLFRTQYALRTIAGEGRAFPPATLAAIAGDHPRELGPRPGAVYVAGIDLAGEAEELEGAALRAANPRRDSTVVTIAEVIPAVPFPSSLRVVAFHRWTGVRHGALYAGLVTLLRDVWHCRRIVVDATGVGAGVASFLRDTLGARIVRPFTFSAASKSDLAFRLLASAGAGRLKLYAGDDDDVLAARRELALARTAARPGGLITLFVDPAEGHDDYVMSIALTVDAAEEYRPRAASGRFGS
jgi:hypothetical protein